MVRYYYRNADGNLRKGVGKVRHRLEETWGWPSPQNSDNEGEDGKNYPALGLLLFSLAHNSSEAVSMVF